MAVLSRCPHRLDLELPERALEVEPHPGDPALLTLASGAHLAGDAATARAVLTSPDLRPPFTVNRTGVPRADSRRRVRAAAAAPGRTDAAAEVYASTLAATLAAAGPGRHTSADLLAPATTASACAALLPDLDPAHHAAVGAAVLGWVAALGPVIAAARPPRRFSATRRRERAARRALTRLLAGHGVPDPAATATALAAAVQVPLAAGAFLAQVLGRRPDLVDALTGPGSAQTAQACAWETLRLFPPSWLLPRVTTAGVTLAGRTLPAYTPVLVSPYRLGRDPALVPAGACPAGAHDPGTFDPARWLSPDAPRPGAWLPFGAGAHACPGRTLALTQLTHAALALAAAGPACAGPLRLDDRRGLQPAPDSLTLAGPQLA